MSWNGVPPELREVIERVCTEKEIEVLKIKASMPNAGRRTIAAMLGISDASVRDRQRSAERKIRQEVAAMRGITPG